MYVTNQQMAANSNGHWARERAEEIKTEHNWVNAYGFNIKRNKYEVVLIVVQIIIYK